MQPFTFIQIPYSHKNSAVTLENIYIYKTKKKPNTQDKNAPPVLADDYLFTLDFYNHN